MPFEKKPKKQVQFPHIKDKPTTSQVLAAQAYRALNKFLLEFKDDVVAVAEYCEVHPQAVYKWIKRGKIGSIAALRLDFRDDCKWTKEKLRPDIADWDRLNGVSDEVRRRIVAGEPHPLSKDAK